MFLTNMHVFLLLKVSISKSLRLRKSRVENTYMLGRKVLHKKQDENNVVISGPFDYILVELLMIDYFKL
jgi:hypothetical protein